MKREHKEKAKAPGKFIPPQDAFFKNRSQIAAAVADPWWDDGTPREPYGLSLNWSTGQCTVSLNDKEEKRSMSSTAESAEEALDAMEGLLASDRRPWRYWGGKASRKA